MPHYTSSPADKFFRIFSGGLPLPQGEGWGEGIMQFPIDYPLILPFSRREKGLLVLLRALEHAEKLI